MKRGRTMKGIFSSLTAMAMLLMASVATAQNPGMNGAGGNPGAGGIYAPPDKATPVQLKAHIEKMQRVAPAARQGGYGEAMVTASQSILDSKPPESLRAFAVVSLMDGLHEWADTEHNTAADQQLAEAATKYLHDNDKKVVITATYYDLEERVLKPNDIPPADIPKVLDEVKAALTGRTLNAAKHMRLANSAGTLINYLPTDEEAEKQFKQLGRMLEQSGDPALVKLGTQLKGSKRDPAKLVPVVATDKPADAAAEAAKPQTAPAAEVQVVETPEKWVERIEARISALMGSEHDAEYDTQKAEFIKQYPNDPLRWRWNLMDARRAISGAKNREEATKKARAALAEVAAAQDAPAELREKAATMTLQLDIFNRAPVDDLAKSYNEFLKAFPNSKARGVLAQSILDLAGGNEISEGAVARLQALQSKSEGLLAAIVGVKIKELETLLALKKTPMELKFTDVEGHEFDLQSYRGKVVLIDFWATWCGPCVAGLPEVIELYKKYHDQGFEIVGISFDEDKSALQEFVKSKDMGWVQFFDGKGWENEYGQKYSIHAIPQMWLIGRDGKIVDFNARAGLPQKISKLLEGSSGKNAGSAAKSPDKS